MTSRPTHRLRLRATDADDLTVLSAALQDAIVPIADMTVEDGRFIAVFNRFKWETADTGETDENGSPVYERTHAGLRIEAVTGVKRRGIDPKKPGAFLEMLSIQVVDDGIEMDFAGGKALRVEVDRLDIFLDDLGDAWPTTNRPDHVITNDG